MLERELFELRAHRRTWDLIDQVYQRGRDVSSGRGWLVTHRPLSELPIAHRITREDDRREMARVAEYPVERRVDRYRWPFQGLEKAASAGDEEASRHSAP